MCRELEQLYLDAQNEGFKQGFARGAKQATLSSIKNLMKTFSWTAETAMEAIEVPEQERQTYLNLLAD